LGAPHGFIGLAGYSFGAFVVLRAMALGARPGAVMLFSPPLDFMSFEGLDPPRVPCLVTLGDRDEFCSRASLEAWLGAGSGPAGSGPAGSGPAGSGPAGSGPAGSGPAGSRPGATSPLVKILRGVDHFYFGAERALGVAVGEFISSLQPGRLRPAS
ncbi:MAG: hypothetical protein RBU30_26870, partial [Polyangia bacterium]|nr:hypothetical protein [Polyangia bacterium]